MAELYARETELARLESYLQQALGGNGQVCLISGEAGAGKTALMEEFGERAAAVHDDLIYVVGTCDAQTGDGDAYLPFREIMQQLTGDIEGKVAQGQVSQDQANRLRKMMLVAGETLVDLAPDLIGVVIPGATLLAKAGKTLAGKSKWAEKLRAKIAERERSEVQLDKSQVYEQYANVLQRLSQEAPLVLVVDDMQWADTASLGLLFRLARRLQGHRILLVGLYRPNDLAVDRGGQRHPLEAVLSEVKRYQGDVTIDLDAAIRAGGRAFIDALIDNDPNGLGDAFRRALEGHTGGHPLFTLELLQNLKERGDLFQDAEGRWVADEGLSWSELPSRIEGVIEERINRLEDDLVRTLQVASVEGPQFAAEVVAKVQPLEPREVIRRLSETLQRQHRLVNAEGMTRVGSQRVSHYRFANQLLQSYLYEMLDEAEASYLHEDMGLALEALYGAEADQVAVQLARHFDLAGLRDKAREYLIMAAKQAAGGYANEQALKHYRKAYEYTPDDDLESRYQLMLEMVGLDNLLAEQGVLFGDIERLTSLAEQLGDPLKRAEAAIQMALYELEAGRHEAAISQAERAVELVGPLDDDGGAEGRARIIWGRALRAQSYNDEAKSQLQKGLVLARLAGNREAEAGAYTILGVLFDVTGQAGEARKHFERALELHTASGNRVRQGSDYMHIALSHWRTGEQQQAAELLERSVAIAREVGDRDGGGKALANLGIIRLDIGEVDRAKQHVEEALEINREIGSPYSLARTLGVYSTILDRLNDPVGARSAELEALELDLAVGDRQDEVFRRLNLGRIALTLGDSDEALEQLTRGLEMSTEIDELWAACSAHGHLSMLHEVFGQAEKAVEQATAAVELAVRLESPINQQINLVRLARAHLAAGDMAAAAAALERGLALAGDDPVFDFAAVRAELALARGDNSAAFKAVEAVIEPALQHELEGASDTEKLYLTIYRTLRAVHDARSRAVLEAGRANLATMSAGLEEAEQLRMFNEHPTYRLLLAG